MLTLGNTRVAILTRSDGYSSQSEMCRNSRARYLPETIVLEAGRVVFLALEVSK